MKSIPIRRGATSVSELHQLCVGRYLLSGLWKRWSLIGFFGVGWRADLPLSLGDAKTVVPAGGGGFRYLIARQLGLNMGMDFAGSDDQFAFYFQVGGSWR